MMYMNQSRLSQWTPLVRLTSFDVDGQEHHLEFIEKIVDEKETIAGIWIKLNSYLNFLNYDILAHVLDKFQNEGQ